MAEKRTVRQGYDELAETYAAKRTEDDRDIAIFDEFLDLFPDPKRVLDVGCGHGTPVLSQLGEKTTAIGVDFSREQLRVAAGIVPTVPLIQGEMRTLPFRNDVFDAITAYNSVIHVPLTDHQAVLDEFGRVLCPGGRLLLSEAPEEFTRTNTDWLGSGVEMRWWMAGTEATREQLRNAGFRITNEWAAPDTSTGDAPKPPFLSARLDE